VNELSRLTAALAERYRIERELGAGGMATVYLAEDLRHARRVAVKVLRPDLSAVLGADRFLNEIRVTANLQHPHILPLFDSGEAHGLLFYVMPFVEGESLGSRIEREKQLPVEEAVRIAREVASALDYAHRHGVIHRDIKPANILLQDGTALVADFGIALAVSKAGGARLTETGLSLGTPYYMSPEQATGDRQIDARSDVYSLGAVLYEMLTGDPPLTGSTAQAVIAAVVTEQPRDVAARRPRVAPHVAEAVHRALEKLPADRFPSAAELARALEGPAAMTGRTAAFRPGRPGRPARRLALPTALVVAGLAAGLALGRWLLAPGEVVERRTRLTFTGDATSPSVSYDGRRLAYIRGACLQPGTACRGDLVIQDLPAGSPTVLIRGARLLGGPVWSPSGASLLVAMQPAGGQTGLYVVSQTGGVPRKLADRAISYGFSDERTAGVLPRRGRLLQYVDVETGQPRDSVTIGGAEWLVASVDFSPRDGRIAFGGFHGSAIRFGIADPRGRILDTLDVVSGGGWDSDGRHVWVAQTDARSNLTLVRIAVGRGGRLTGRPVEFISGVRQDEWSGFALTTTGLVIGDAGRVTDVWGFSVGGASRRLTHSSSWYLSPDISRDGREVAYVKQDARGANVYAARLDSGAERPVTADSGMRQVVRWLPDGRRISYAALGAGAGGGFLSEVMELETGRRRDLRAEPGFIVAEWLPNGSAVAWRIDGRGFAVRDSTGRAVRAFAVPDSIGVLSGRPLASPDGADVAFAAVRERRRDLFALSVADGSVRRIGELPAGDTVTAFAVRWANDGFVYFARAAGDSPPDLWRLPARGGAAQRVAAFPVACQLGTLSLSADARAGACLVVDQRPDLWLVERHR